MAYAERRERKKGVRYRGIYKAADGRYRSAGTFSTEKQALAGRRGGRAARRRGRWRRGRRAGSGHPRDADDQEYAPVFLRHHQVEGNTKDTYADTLRLHVIPFLGGCRLAETDRTVVKVSRQHHPQGKTFLVRDDTKNRQTRKLKLDGAVVELVRGYLAEQGIGEREVMFPAELVVPPRRTKPRLTEEEIRALGDCEPVSGRVYAHGTLGGYVQAKCRCAGCRQ